MINATRKFKRMLHRAETGIRHKITKEKMTDADLEFYRDVWECLNALKFIVRFESNVQVHELRALRDDLEYEKDNENNA